MGEFDGMYNPRTGDWNPSPDSMRYDSSNSMTGMDFALGGVGIRKFGIGSKPPIWAKIGNAHASATYKGAKAIYRGQNRIRAWKRTQEAKITKALKKDTRATPYGMNRKQMLIQKSKRVGRFLNSKKGRAISTGTILGLGHHASKTMNNLNEDSWVVRKNKKRRIGFR